HPVDARDHDLPATTTPVCRLEAARKLELPGLRAFVDGLGDTLRVGLIHHDAWGDGSRIEGLGKQPKLSLVSGPFHDILGRTAEANPRSAEMGNSHGVLRQRAISRIQSRPGQVLARVI